MQGVRVGLMEGCEGRADAGCEGRADGGVWG